MHLPFPFTFQRFQVRAEGLTESEPDLNSPPPAKVFFFF